MGWRVSAIEAQYAAFCIHGIQDFYSIRSQVAIEVFNYKPLTPPPILWKVWASVQNIPWTINEMSLFNRVVT